jgi:GNAT superfamily N-acetyltransferase
MRALVDEGRVPGILAYAEGRAVGWCSVAPREEFSGLARSRILKSVDETPVWSIVCFFVAKDHRRQGVTIGLIRAAVDYARKRGAEAVEAYPVEPRAGKMQDAFAFTGLASAFLRAGFSKVLRRSETRPIMRFVCVKPDEA